MRVVLGSFVAISLVACSTANPATPSNPNPTDAAVDADLGAQRAACTFGPGAHVTETLGLTPAQRAAIPIKNVIVVMKENRSFDHLLGKLHETQPDVEAIPPTFTNKDKNGAAVAPFHEPTTCVSHDPDHQWLGMHSQVNGGAMDGFVTSAAYSTGTDGHFVMGNYDASDLPFYYWFASTFALEDRHFPSVRSGTFPNRNFLLLGTADGVGSTGAGFPKPTTPTIFGLLDAASVSWGVYSDGSLLSGTLDWTATHRGAHPFKSFLASLDAGTLPQVSFVDGIDNVEDEHPTGDLQQGESWTRNVYEHAIHSTLWPGLALVWTYDEAGGFADHVPPPNDACVARPEDASFHELGVRVPLVVASPYAKPHYVSHVTEDHTAITRFIETVFDLPALTARDANSTALLEMFDFTKPALLQPPDAPQAGTGKCSSVVLTVDKPFYAPGDPVVVTFKNAPGNQPKDRIALFTYTANGPTPPGPGSLAYQYIGGMHTPTSSPANGNVTLDASTLDTGAWPLPKGGYIAYYLLNGGLSSVASIDFNVQ